MSVVGKGSENRLKIYNYDSFNQLTAYYDALSSASYTYNADGLRMSKTVNGNKTEFTWDGQNLAGEETGDSLNTYTYDVTGISSAVIDGVYRTYMKDTHGSVVGYYNAAGERMKQYDYDAFGNRLEGSDPDPFGYCGEYYDSESGNIYLRARYYNSETGRFISEDPAKDGVNWYVYCGGDPVMNVDPSGLVGIPTKGSQSYNELLSAIVELLDAKANYDIYQKDGASEETLGKISESAQQVRDNKIKTCDALWYSEALYDLVDKHILNNENGGTEEEVSAVLAVVAYLRNSLINSNKMGEGEEFVEENEVESLYEGYYKDDVIYTVENAGISGYSILGHTYAQKVLCYDTPQLQLGQAAYKGKNANGEDKIVIIFDRMDPDQETLEDFE